MKKGLTILFLLIFAATAFAQESVWFDGSFDEAKTKAEKENKFLLINFDSPG
ncbi:hypothetical protein ACFL6G_04160 [candidate division KSB1 bacterium]